MIVEFHAPQIGVTIEPPIAKEPFPTYDGEYEITPTTEEQTIQTKNKYMSDDITVNAMGQGSVLPYAIKGSVSNNSVVITPKAQVNQGGGWISGGTYTGIDRVTVRASELVSGSKTITENGTIDVTNYASAVVNVQPSVTGDITITQNGTFDVTSYANAIVNVAGGGGADIETGIFSPTSNISQPTIQFSRARDTKPFFVMIADCSTVSASTLPSSSSNIMWCLYRPAPFIGDAIIGKKSGTAPSYTYAIVDYMYATSSTTTARNLIDSAEVVEDYLTSSEFKPWTYSNTRYWRKDRTYKWVAVWE